MIVYGLSDPRTGELRYVGKTERDLAVRLIEHRYNARRNRTHLYCWWRSLPVEPGAEVLETCVSIEALNRAEVAWIAKARAEGRRLVNHTDGGEGQTGLKHTPETRARISASCKRLGVGKWRLGMETSVKTRVLKSRLRGGRPFVDQHGNIYQTIKGAARDLNLPFSMIQRNLKGVRPDCRGYVFHYQEDPNLPAQER